MTTHVQRLSTAHEDEVAEAFGGQTTPMSGAGWVRKHDVQTPVELIECKATETLSYSVKRVLLRDLELEALRSGKRPVLDIKLASQGQRPRRWVVLTEEDYLELTRKAGERPW